MRRPAFDLRDFTPKLVDALRKGYRLADLRADATAGLTVAIVAIPLSMALAVASGVKPEQGLFTAVVGGFLISAFGGVRHQIGGPAGAFVVIVAGIVSRHGYEGLAVATILAGAMLILAGLLRVGDFVKFVPHPVVAGFTAGIAFIIFTSQAADLLGLDISGAPADVVGKWRAIAAEASRIDGPTAGLGLGTLALILAIRRRAPKWPFFLIGLVAASAAVWAFGLPVETIGTRFGGVPNVLPAPSLPALAWDRVWVLMPDAAAIAFLGGIESLLCAVVADGMTGRRHRSNAELVAQGVANVGSIAFGGMPATGTIARTATNIRSGARTPVAGMLHAAFVGLAMLAFAPLAASLPMAALAAVLVVVAYNMSEWRGLVALMRAPAGERAVALTTLGLTVFWDLTAAIQAGIVMAAFLFMHRMSAAVELEAHDGLLETDDDSGPDGAIPLDRIPPDVRVFQMSGPFFFGVASMLADRLREIERPPRVFVLRMGRVPLMDASGAHALERFAAEAYRRGARVILTNVKGQPRRMVASMGIASGEHRVVLAKNLEKALALAAAWR